MTTPLRLIILRDLHESLNILVNEPEAFGAKEEEQAKAFEETCNFWITTREAIRNAADMYSREKQMNLSTDDLTRFRQCERFIKMLRPLYEKFEVKEPRT